jgi:hypothetical protein
MRLALRQLEFYIENCEERIHDDVWILQRRNGVLADVQVKHRK